MKKIFSLLLALVLCLSLCACGGNTAEETVQETAQEQLNEKELSLFNYLIKLTSDDFFEPSAVRVLEIGDYEDRTRYKGTDREEMYYGPDTIVVRLQGENKVGGTLNHYYMIALNSAENTSSYAQNSIELSSSLIMLGGNYASNFSNILEYRATAGQYAQLSDYYTIEEQDENYNAGNINRAIAEYWEELGF